MTTRVDFGEASDMECPASEPSHDVLPDGLQTMTGGGLSGKTPRFLTHWPLLSGCVALMASPLVVLAGESHPRIDESVGLRSDDFVTDPAAFTPGLLARVSSPWLVTAEAVVPAFTVQETPTCGPGGSFGTSTPAKVNFFLPVAKWFGVFGFVLLLLRRSHRYL